MTFLRSAVFSVAALGFVAGAPLTAHAIEVECTLRDGSTCTVRNDPDDFASCLCGDESSTAGSGANDWADFDEELLLEICLSELASCEAMDTDGGTTGMTTSTTGVGTTGDDTGGAETGGSTGGVTGATGGSSSTGDEPGGSGPSTNPSDTDSNGTASGGDTSPGTTTGPAPGGDEGDGSSSSGADADNQDPSGCSVGGHGGSGVLFGMFGLALGLRSRRLR